MKTKIVYLLGFLLCCHVSLKAQMLSGGIMGEISSASVKITHIPNQTINAIEGNNIMGYGIGLYAKGELSIFFVKPCLLFNFQHGTVNVNTSEGNTFHSTFDCDKLEVPVLFGIRLLGPVHIEGGPVYNWLINTTDNFNGDVVDFQKSGLGYRLGAGLDVGRISADINYQGIKFNSTDASQSTYQLPNQLIISLGIRLGKGEK